MLSHALAIAAVRVLAKHICNLRGELSYPRDASPTIQRAPVSRYWFRHRAGWNSLRDGSRFHVETPVCCLQVSANLRDNEPLRNARHLVLLARHLDPGMADW